MRMLKFLSYFSRVHSENREETTIRFELEGVELNVSQVGFDAGGNAWTVYLKSPETINKRSV